MKSKVISALAVGFMVFSVLPVSAASVPFSSKKVDSNEWTYVVSITRDTTKNSVGVNLSSILKADGSSSNYKNVRAKYKVGSNNALDNLSESKLVLGQTVSVKLKPAYQKEGVKVEFYAMGNDPKLDCKITGRFYGDINK